MCWGKSCFAAEWLSNYLFIFSLSACDIRNEQPARPQIGDFGDTFKTLTISQLNFIDTCFIPKMDLKEPEQTCKRATVEAQLILENEEKSKLV